MTQIAVQAATGGKDANWLRRVTEEEILAEPPAEPIGS
jgi:hypothetical protein